MTADTTHENFMEMSREDFCARFTAEMLRLVGPIYYEEDDPEPSDTKAYADEVGESYFDDESQREDGPEACAASDYGYWDN